MDLNDKLERLAEMRSHRPLLINVNFIIKEKVKNRIIKQRNIGLDSMFGFKPSSETSYLPVALTKSLNLCEPGFPHL